MAMYNKNGRKSQKQLKKERIQNADLQEDGMSYDEIAEILGITKREVMKIERRALQKLQKPNEQNKRLRTYHKE